MSARPCCGAFAQASRSRTQALRFQLRSRSETPQNGSSRPFHRSAQTYQAAASKPRDGRPTLTTAPVTPPDAPIATKLASQLRKTLPAAAGTGLYAAYGETQSLFSACSSAGDYSGSAPTSSPSPPPLSSSSSSSSSSSATAAAPGAPIPSASPYNKSKPPEPLRTAAGEEIFYPATPDTWHARYSLPPTFATWAQVTTLHLYVLQVRLRMFPAEHERKWTQQLVDHFFYAAEEKMDGMHGIVSRGIRSRYLKDLYDQYRGCILSYDEGLVKGDAVLAAAVWRNIWQASEAVDARALAEVVAWIRRSTSKLGQMDDQEFVARKWMFGPPWSGEREVDKDSRGLKEPFLGGGGEGARSGSQ